MRNTKSREMAINESKKANKYKLLSPQGMADMKKPSGTTLMSSSSALSLNRQRMGQDTRRILSPTEHSNNMILGSSKTPNQAAHRRDRSQRIIERVTERTEKKEDTEDTHV